KRVDRKIGMIHKKLYAGENLAAIEMKDYFSHLADYIVDAFGMQNQVDIAVNMKELELDVDIAIPIGLIVNELLVNSLKYAFPDNRRGKIHISLKQTGTLVQLDVKDDGIGHKKENKAIETGFGTRLIKLLTKQLEGKMLLNIDQGTHVSIQFKCNKAA
ncbi:MAG: sensor histidine kinase, partial [Flavobacteriaceae bacterium]